MASRLKGSETPELAGAEQPLGSSGRGRNVSFLPPAEAKRIFTSAVDRRFMRHSSLMIETY